MRDRDAGSSLSARTRKAAFVVVTWMLVVSAACRAPARGVEGQTPFHGASLGFGTPTPSFDDRVASTTLAFLSGLVAGYMERHRVGAKGVRGWLVKNVGHTVNGAINGADVAVEGEVSVRPTDRYTVILVAKSSSGRVSCAVVSTKGGHRASVTFGTGDALVPDECLDARQTQSDTAAI